MHPERRARVTLLDGNRTLEELDRLTMEALEREPGRLAATCTDFRSRADACVKIQANELDLWWAGGVGDKAGGVSEGEWMASRVPLGRAHMSSAGAVRPGGGATFVYAAGAVRTRWKPFNRLTTTARVDIMHVDV